MSLAGEVRLGRVSPGVGPGPAHAPAPPRPSVRAAHVAGPAAPEQHPRDGEVREAADAPRHQLQLGVRHRQASAHRRTAGRKLRRAHAGAGRAGCSAPARGAGPRGRGGPLAGLPYFTESRVPGWWRREGFPVP